MTDPPAVDDRSLPGGAALQAPAWFEQAVAIEPDVHAVTVDGCRVNYLSWGSSGASGIILIHGGAAHAHWWDHLAPLLADEGRRVVAVDLSGHGDSGWRKAYTFETWADEVAGVAEDAGMPDGAVLVGHSMGGFAAVAAAARHPYRWGGTVVVDAGLRPPSPEERPRTHRRRAYSDLETALGRFRLIPPQPSPPAYVLDHIARRSLRRQQDGAWSWKFDAAFFERREAREEFDFAGAATDLTCPLAWLHGQRSVVVDGDVVGHVRRLLGPSTPIVEIPEAHHHLILDRPLAFVAALRTLLAVWGDSAGAR